jgi:hypothetical protein
VRRFIRIPDPEKPVIISVDAIETISENATANGDTVIMFKGGKSLTIGRRTGEELVRLLQPEYTTVGPTAP